MYQNENFFFSHSQLVLSHSGLKRSHNDVFQFFPFFRCFFFNSQFRVGLEWIGTIIFFSLILSLSRPILAWKEAIIIFFNFLNYFEFFWEFYIPDRVGTDQNENFFFSLFLDHSQTVLASNEHIMLFLNFFAIFLEFSIPGRVITDRNGKFIFSLSQRVPSRFGFKKNHYDVFLIFCIFLQFFWNSLFQVGYELIGMIICFFSLSRPLPTHFGLKWSHNDVF